MKKKIELIMGLILVIGAIVASHKLSNYVATAKVEDEQEKIVVLDAGHGAADSGKVGVNDVLEKDLNLQIAKKVQVNLEKEGIQVVMTRDDDQGLYDDTVSNKKLEDMKKRVALINEAKPHLVVSIHQNSYSDSSIKGAQVFYYEHSKEGEAVAGVMQEELRTLDSENKRQIKANDTYYLLKHTEVPTIIVECGFLSNPQEAEKLGTEDYQNQVAEAICTGVIKWLAK